MLTPDVFRARRARLHAAVTGPVLLLGNGTRARNLPMNPVAFRQDSTFWYLTGCARPDAAAWLEDGRCTLYLPAPSEDDDLWHGHVESFDALREAYGVDEVAAFDPDVVRALASRAPRVLAVGDEAMNALAAAPERPLRFGRSYGDPELVHAVIALRRAKDADELAQLREAARHSVDAHRLVMALTRPGVHERSLAALFEAYLASHGCAPGYGTILTQHGEILHNHAHDARCQAGRLLLLDGGGELTSSGYGADITRTWPVSGRFSERQKAAYQAVLEAQRVAIAMCRPGVRYRDVHDAACKVIARFLLDERLLRDTSVDAAVERGAHALFFPHGVGHHLGMDVHDLENFGDLPSYPPGVGRSELFGTCYLRLDLPLERGWVVTIEPGFYVVPAILGNSALRARFSDIVDVDAWTAWTGFGGIRIEDDVVITDDEPEVLTARAPKSVTEIEAVVGTGARIEAWLS